MKLSFELARSQVAPPGVITGRALTPPMPVMKPEYVTAFRELERLSEGLNQRMARSYDAATTTNLNQDFRGTYGSANTEMLPQKYTVRARARTLAKDTAHGKTVVRSLAANVVGDDPFDLEMEFGTWEGTGDTRKFKENDEVNRAIENGWKRFRSKKNFTVRKTMGFMEAMLVVEKSRVRDGSILCRTFTPYPENPFGFAVDFLEEDRLQEQYNGLSPADGMFGGGNPIRASIEYHKDYGYPLAYWILTRHPGEFYNQPLMSRNGEKLFREQVPASQIIHFNNLRDRAEQDIGMTELDATIQPLWRNHQYDKSLVVAAIASCMKPFVIEKDLPTGLQMPQDLLESYYNAPLANGTVANVAGGSTANPAALQQNAARPAQVASPGSREELPFGAKLKVLDPKFPIEAAHDFRNDNLRDIAVGAGLSYQDISGDFQNLGFIAGLMCQQPKQRNCRIRQNALIEDLLELFERWLRAAIGKGYFEKYEGVELSILDVEKYVAAAKFKGQQWEFVNPLVEAQALILLNEAGHLSRQQVQDRLPNGIKVDRLMDMLAQDRDEIEARQLLLGAEATTGEPLPGGAEPADTAGGEPPSKKKTANPLRGADGKFIRARIDPRVMELIEHSSNGVH